MLQYAMTVGRCKYSWGSGCAVSLPAGPGQCPGGGPGGKAPGSSQDTSFYSTKNGPKIDAFLPGNYKNWKTKNISENNWFLSGIFYTFGSDKSEEQEVVRFNGIMYIKGDHG